MNIVRCESKEKLLNVVPKQYRDKAHSIPDSDAPYSLAVLKGSVAHSRDIEKVLSKSSAGTRVIVAAKNISQEAAQCLSAVDGYALTMNDFFWTDDRYRHIQAFGGPKEKPREKNS